MLPPDAAVCQGWTSVLHYLRCSPPSNLASLLLRPELLSLSNTVPLDGVWFVNEDLSSAFCDFVTERVRCEHENLRINRIDRVIVNNARMASYMQSLREEMDSLNRNPVLRPENPISTAFSSGLAALTNKFERIYPAGGDIPQSFPCNIVFAWHVTPPQHVEAVCRDGPRPLRTTDGGYFGAGSYFALEMNYAARYAMMQAPSVNGDYPVILFAVKVANAYVVSPDADYVDDPSLPERWGFSRFYGARPDDARALMPMYNAHFVPVRHCGYTHSRTGEPLPHDTNYQAAVEADATAHELVAYGHEQAIPVAVVWLQVRNAATEN